MRERERERLTIPASLFQPFSVSAGKSFQTNFASFLGFFKPWRVCLTLQWVGCFVLCWRLAPRASQDDCLFGSSGSPAGRHVIRFSVRWGRVYVGLGWVGLGWPGLGYKASLRPKKAQIRNSSLKAQHCMISNCKLCHCSTQQIIYT